MPPYFAVPQVPLTKATSGPRGPSQTKQEQDNAPGFRRRGRGRGLGIESHLGARVRLPVMPPRALRKVNRERTHALKSQRCPQKRLVQTRRRPAGPGPRIPVIRSAPNAQRIRIDQTPPIGIQIDPRWPCVIGVRYVPQNVPRLIPAVVPGEVGNPDPGKTYPSSATNVASNVPPSEPRGRPYSVLNGGVNTKPPTVAEQPLKLIQSSYIVLLPLMLIV